MQRVMTVVDGKASMRGRGSATDRATAALLGEDTFVFGEGDSVAIPQPRVTLLLDVPPPRRLSALLPVGLDMTANRVSMPLGVG